jgi:hypothetical protein
VFSETLEKYTRLQDGTTILSGRSALSATR